jgi:hypothetical protein
MIILDRTKRGPTGSRSTFIAIKKPAGLERIAAAFYHINLL